MLGGRGLGFGSPRATIGSSSTNGTPMSSTMVGLGFTPKSRLVGGPGVKIGRDEQEDGVDKENNFASMSNEDSPEFVSKKSGKKKKKYRRSSIGLETLAPIDLGEDEDEIKADKDGEDSESLNIQNPNDVSDLMSFEEVEALHKESDAEASMPPPPPRTPQHTSSNIDINIGSNSGSGKKRRKKKKGGSTGKKKNRLKVSPPKSPPNANNNNIGMHTLLLSPSLVSSAPCYSTPIRPSNTTTTTPAQNPSIPSDSATPDKLPSNSDETVTPENFHNFLDGVKSGIANDASELWTGFQSLFGYRNVGLTSFNTMHTNNNNSTFTAEEIAATAEKIKNTFTLPTNLVSQIATSVKAPMSATESDAALRQRMPGLWREGMVKHEGQATATSTSVLPSTVVTKGTVSNHVKTLTSPPLSTPSTPPASKQHELTEEEVLKSTTNIVESRSSVFGERIVTKKKWYAVIKGVEPGIYTTWPDAEKQVKGFPGAIFKGFKSEGEARAYLDTENDGSAAVQKKFKTSTLGVVKKLPCTPMKEVACADMATQNPHAAMMKMLASRKPPSSPKEEETSASTATVSMASTSGSSSLDFGAVGENVNIAKLEAGNGKGFHLFWVLPDGTLPSNTAPSVALVLNSTRIILISTSGQTGTISWSMPRENVKSLIISNCGPTATLLFNDDSSKSFTFKTMESCFGFVQEHYKTNLEKGNKPTTSESKAPPPKSQGPSAFDAAMSKLSNTDKEAVNKYRKMRKMRLPEAVVRHKMKQESFEKEELISLVFMDGKESKPVEATKVEPPKQEQKSKLSDEDEGILKKYRMMLKLHVPPAAVVHKMKMEEIENRLIVTLFPEEGAEGSKPPGKEKKPPPTLTTAEEQVAKKYRTMLKMHVPPGAVKHKMGQEGVAKNIVLALFPEDEKEAKKNPRIGGKKSRGKGDDKETNAGTAKKQTRTGKRTTGDTSIQLKQIHWTPLSEDQVRKSVWARVSQTKTFGGGGGDSDGVEAARKGLSWTASVDNSDIKMMEELFHKKTGALKKSSDAGKEQPGSVKKKQKKMAGLIDLTRCNNIAISLKAFKEFTFDELVDILNTLDPKRKIVGDRIAFLSSVLPNDIEAKQIANFRGPDDELLPAELFFKKLEGVKRVTVKIKVMETMDTFGSHLKDLQSRLQLMKRVCDQVMSSEKLQRVLETILAIGNIMNEGTNKGDIGGFTFDSLLKLTQTKSVDGKTTVLDYIVTTFATKGQIDNLRLEGEFEESFQASRINFGEIIAEVRTMNGNVERCKGELKKMKAEERTSDGGGKKGVNEKKSSGGGRKVGKLGMGKTSGQSGDVGALFASIKGVKKEEGGKAPPGGGMAGVLAGIKGMKKKEKEGGAPPGGGMAGVLAGIKNRGELTKKKNWQDEKEEEALKWQQPQEESEGTKRLKIFIDMAAKDLQELEQDKLRGVESCKELALYFGESGGEASATRLLGILTEFAKSITKAIGKYERRLKEEARKAAQAKAAFKNNKTKFESLAKKNPQNVPLTPVAQGVEVRAMSTKGKTCATSPKHERRGAILVDGTSKDISDDKANGGGEKKEEEEGEEKKEVGGKKKELEVQIDPRANLLKMLASRPPPKLETPTKMPKASTPVGTPRGNPMGTPKNKIQSPGFVNNNKWKY